MCCRQANDAVEVLDMMSHEGEDCRFAVSQIRVCFVQVNDEVDALETKADYHKERIADYEKKLRKIADLDSPAGENDFEAKQVLAYKDMKGGRDVRLILNDQNI